MSDKTMEEFEAWADEKGFCLDQLFMSTDGVPDNPYENEDTKLAYEIWCASRSPGCSKASAQQLADALDDIWLCANSGYLLEALKSKIALYVEGEISLTKGF